MKLYVLKFGRTKAGKKTTVMIDSLHKVEQYKKARETGKKGTKSGSGFHEIEPAEPGAKVWRIKSSTIGGNKDIGTVNGRQNGYISKEGFNPHT